MTATDSKPGSRRGRPNDPGRRDRIIDACLDVVAEHGVAGASHRKVAEAAGVPLGSMTYHFAGFDELLHEAFDRFTAEFAQRFETRMAKAGTPEEAREAVITIILEDVFIDRRTLVLTHELYTLAAREPAFRDLTSTWMGRSRAALELHFSAQTSRLLDAAIEGLTIHSALATEPLSRDDIVEAVDRIVRPRTPSVPHRGKGTRL